MGVTSQVIIYDIIKKQEGQLISTPTGLTELSSNF